MKTSQTSKKRKDSEEVLLRQEDVRTGKDMLQDLILTPSFPLIPTFSPPQIKSAPPPLKPINKLLTPRSL